MAIDNLSNYLRDVNEFSEFTEAQLVLLHQAVGFELLKRIIWRTPADWGEARGGWQVTIGAPSSSVGVEDRDGNTTYLRAAAIIGGVRAPCTIHVVNNVPHAVILDQGLFDPKDPGPSQDPRPDRFGRILVRGGYSQQAPQGMVDVSVAELSLLFEME